MFSTTPKRPDRDCRPPEPRQCRDSQLHTLTRFKNSACLRQTVFPGGRLGCYSRRSWPSRSTARHSRPGQPRPRVASARATGPTSAVVPYRGRRCHVASANDAAAASMPPSPFSWLAVHGSPSRPAAACWSLHAIRRPRGVHPAAPLRSVRPTAAGILPGPRARHPASRRWGRGPSPPYPPYPLHCAGLTQAAT